MSYAIKVNDQDYSVEYPPETPLVWVLRDLLGRKAVMIGCGRGQCGACSVWLNDEVQKSCSIGIAAADGAVITTVGYPRPKRTTNAPPSAPAGPAAFSPPEPDPPEPDPPAPRRSEPSLSEPSRSGPTPPAD